MRVALEEMGHLQHGATIIYVDNKTAAAIANDILKRQKSRPFNMQYFGSVMR